VRFGTNSGSGLENLEFFKLPALYGGRLNQEAYNRVCP
jgi:hypothetical protein